MRFSLLAIALSGCCGRSAPIWDEVPPVYLDGAPTALDMSAWVTDDRGPVSFSVSFDEDAVIAEVTGDRLDLTPQPDFADTTLVRVTATDRCGNASPVEIVVDGASDPAEPSGNCPVTLDWPSPNTPDAVSVAGSFNDWDPQATPLSLEDGVWTVTLALAPGAYPYKFVEHDAGLFDASGSWTCDPSAPYIQCDADTSWEHSCVPGQPSCNSLLVVEPCEGPELELLSLDIDRPMARVDVAFISAGAEETTATLDGQPVTLGEGPPYTLALEGLSPGRHTLRVSATQGESEDHLYIPFWIDDFSWEDAVLYFAFVDRLANGDPSLDTSEGATGSGYEGGDLQGVIDMLPYLDDLGVSVLWLSNPQDNAEGAWAGDCEATYAGYHAYWPDAPYAVEEHFGTAATLQELVDAAHARGMRVMVDWVANHVHSAHPYFAAHPQWFNGIELCTDQVDGQLNFDRIPETCWFAPYLPDIDYSQPEPLALMVDDALWWATTYGLDGFRVDAVKHMSHAVSWNLRSAIDEHITHKNVGGDERFLTLGETFDSAPKILEYIGETQLDGQFDFPLYYALRSTFATQSTSLPDLMSAVDASQRDFEGATMSTFLGNHDVLRFTTEAVDGWQDPCGAPAKAPTDAWAYERIALAWTVLFTQPGIPLIYYGDELGMPGFGDPDNRQPLWSHAGAVAAGAVSSVDDLAAQVSPHQAQVLRHVAALTKARQDHISLRRGAWVEWWNESEVYAYARSYDEDHTLILLNRSDSPRALSNGLSFAGLPADGTYEDLLTQETFTAAGDGITVDLEPRSSRILVYR
jgi:neopullulanase